MLTALIVIFLLQFSIPFSLPAVVYMLNTIFHIARYSENKHILSCGICRPAKLTKTSHAYSPSHLINLSFLSFFVVCELESVSA